MHLTKYEQFPSFEVLKFEEKNIIREEDITDRKRGFL